LYSLYHADQLPSIFSAQKLHLLKALLRKITTLGKSQTNDFYEMAEIKSGISKLDFFRFVNQSENIVFWAYELNDF